METIREIIVSVWELILSLRQTVRVVDALDIIIVAYVIYRILSLMRKTGASSVIKGIIFVLVIAWLSNELRLNVTTFILNQLLGMGVIILVVLFQPELRKLFEQVGTNRLSSIFRKRVKRETAENALRNTLIAAEAMSAERTGALIVFEREVGLNEFAVSGTTIDANVDSALIQNIFYHNSPLHDGALIVRDGRLLAAACILPLTNNINLSPDLGMRHRAAVGISERSDAVVVVVSEQTGTISVAVDGMIKRNLEPETFELLLRNELMLTDRRKKKSKKKKNKRVKE